MSDLTGFGIESAVKRIQNYAKVTPLLTSSTLNRYFAELLNLPVQNSPKLFFKCENFQKTGSFKCRGAINAVSKVLEADESIQGFVTQSAGNHGQALAFAASCFGKKCVVVAPENASKAKIDAMKHYGAEI
uniref:Tryptophan synthase beta chain-like PALP domain-containing protein n=1 Tax=Panagrolaimus sp. JU765 TaxID=591449 RepID=A0AC34Q740_9BILA